MATQDREFLVLLLAWGYYTAALRGEAPREFSRGTVRAWLESGSPLTVKKLAHIAPSLRHGWLDDAAREVAVALARLCYRPELDGPEENAPESGNRAVQSVRLESAPRLPCFFAMPVGPDPYRSECVRCLWSRIGQCRGRAA